MTYLFITHDLSLAWVISDRIAVMYLGKIVEIGETEEVVANPQHPYTKALISRHPGARPARPSASTPSSPARRPTRSAIPTGCRFHPRCPEVHRHLLASSRREDVQIRGTTTPPASRIK